MQIFIFITAVIAVQYEVGGFLKLKKMCLTVLSKENNENLNV